MPVFCREFVWGFATADRRIVDFVVMDVDSWDSRRLCLCAQQLQQALSFRAEIFLHRRNENLNLPPTRSGWEISPSKSVGIFVWREYDTTIDLHHRIGNSAFPLEVLLADVIVNAMVRVFLGFSSTLPACVCPQQQQASSIRVRSVTVFATELKI